MAVILPSDDPAIVASRDAPPRPPDVPPPSARREQRFQGLRPGTVVMTLGITLGILAVLSLGYLAWQALTWMLIAAFLAMALNPVVVFLERRGLRRGVAAAATFLAALCVVGAVAFLIVPPLVREVIDFVEALPGILKDAENGRGPLGYLERRFNLVERLEEGLASGGVGGVLGFATPAIDVMKTVLTTIFSLVAIAFLTFFMLLDGRRWVGAFLDFVPQTARPRWERAFNGIYRTVGGYVTGNLVVCVLAGVVAGLVMTALGVPYAIPLALVAGFLNLIPMIGAPIAAVALVIVTFVSQGWVDGVIVLAVYVVYQQVENHLIQPLIYGRAVNLSPLAILVTVLIGAELGGILGAIAAIPVGGSIAVVAGELLRWRREAMIQAPAGVDLAVDSHPLDKERDG